jgi:glycosyltransferase involved in cell wall biosynthesis
MRILQIVKYYYPAMTFGGPVRCVYNLSKYLAKKGHKVTVYTTDALSINTNTRIKEKHQLLENVEVFFFPNLTRSYGLFISPGIFKALRKNIENFDVIHLHEYRTFQNLAFYYTNTLKTPYVLTLHGQLFTIYVGDRLDHVILRNACDSLFGKRLLRSASKILALTRLEATKCDQLGIDHVKIVVIPNGIDPKDFSNLPEKGEFRSQYGITQENIILYLGRVNRRKGIDVLINACSDFFRHQRDTKLVIAGADDGFLNEAKRMVKSLTLENRVLFTGGLTRRQVLAAYNEATIVVHASTQEGFPIVPLEAGIMGKPIVVSDDPAMDFVRKGRFGLTVKYGSVTQLKEALEMIFNDPEMARELGARGKKFIKENYGWETIGKRIEDIYYNLLR